MKKKFSVEKEIYSKESLLEAIEDFKEACSITFQDDFSLEFE